MFLSSVSFGFAGFVTHTVSHMRETVLRPPLMILDSPIMDLCSFFSFLVFSYISIIDIKARPEVPNLLAWGSVFVEDNFSVDQGWWGRGRMVQVK